MQYDDRLFIELQVQYMKIPSSSLGRTCCVQKLLLTFRKFFVHDMFSPCSAKRRASDKDLPVRGLRFLAPLAWASLVLTLPLACWFCWYWFGPWTQSACCMVPQAVVVVLVQWPPIEDIFEDEAVNGADAVTAKFWTIRLSRTIFRSRNVVWLEDDLNCACKVVW